MDKQGMTALEAFRRLAHLPIVQYLTWYILLVQKWDFDNIADFSIREEKNVSGDFGQIVNKYFCSFRFKRDTHPTSLAISENNGRFRVDSSFSLAEKPISDYVEANASGKLYQPVAWVEAKTEIHHDEISRGIEIHHDEIKGKPK
jgi:hypothetical protein